jgi:predicted transcriptional regulator
VVREARRGKLESYGDILAAINNEISTNREAMLTKVSSRAGMPYTRFKEHIETLNRKGLITLTEVGDHVRIDLTESGWSYLREYEMIKRFLATFGLD